MKDKERLTLENQLCFPIYACSREIIKAYRPYLERLDLTYTQYIVMLVLLFVIALMLQRLFNGPTIFDRMNALGVIGADTICLIVVFGFIDKRPDMYVDIAISYALLGFLGSLIVAKFIGGNKI